LRIVKRRWGECFGTSKEKVGEASRFASFKNRANRDSSPTSLRLILDYGKY
jgi:hypothetical protein